MSGLRRAYLDRSPGEVRAVVTLDGRPERLIVAWEDDPTPRLGARYAARVEAVSQRLGLARLDIGVGLATLKLRPDHTPAAGARLEVEVAAEPAGGKPAMVKRVGPTEARPGLLQPAASPEAQLAALGFAEWKTGEDARDVADDAEAQALALAHGLPNGLNLRIEPTRALVAIDVDLAEAGGSPSVARANVDAIGQTARLLRLKALGGLAAIDLIGFPKDGRRLHAAAVEAFAPDGPEVAIAPPSRFGVMELAKPRRRQPLHEQLGEATAAHLNARATAQALVRALERQGRHAPGDRLQASAAPAAAALAVPLVARLGPRFGVRLDLGRGPGDYDIKAL